MRDDEESLEIFQALFFSLLPHHSALITLNLPASPLTSPEKYCIINIEQYFYFKKVDWLPFMTHILFLPDDRTLLQLEAAETADELMEAVNSGRWQPPEPYSTGFSRTGDSQEPGLFYASRQGNLVVVMLTRAAAADLKPPAGSLPVLSPRLLEVLHGLAEGLTTRQIAVRLGVTPRMVQYHVSEIKRRLGARSRAQSVSRAQALGMVRRRK